MDPLTGRMVDERVDRQDGLTALQQEVTVKLQVALDALREANELMVGRYRVTGNYIRSIYAVDDAVSSIYTADRELRIASNDD